MRLCEVEENLPEFEVWYRFRKGFGPTDGALRERVRAKNNREARRKVLDMLTDRYLTSHCCRITSVEPTGK